jgi:hypothetical protein
VNFQGAFEGALAASFVNTGKTSLSPRIRVWHCLEDDAEWSPTSDRGFPIVAFRAKPPMTDEENGVTQQCSVQILIGTNAKDDQDHQDIATLQSAIQELCANIYAQWRDDDPDKEREEFDDYISSRYPDIDDLISIGGFQHGETLEPFEEGGANYEGKEFIIHYSRSDY